MIKAGYIEAACLPVHVGLGGARPVVGIACIHRTNSCTVVYNVIVVGRAVSDGLTVMTAVCVVSVSDTPKE